MPTNCLSVSDHFVGLALKELRRGFMRRTNFKLWYFKFKSHLQLEKGRCVKEDIVGICPLPLIIFRIKSLLFNPYFILALFLFFIVALLLCPQFIHFFQACTLLTGYTFLILIIPNTFRFKCILYNVNKTENSGGENALIFKKVGAKLKKDFIFYKVLLSFFQKLGKQEPPANPPIL